MAEDSSEEIIFGQDDEPVKAQGAQSAEEDAAQADMKQAQGSEAETEEPAEADTEEEVQDPVAKELEETKTRYMYLYAEYDNYRKRTAKEKDNLYSDAVAKVTGEFLAVIDNIDRAIAATNGAGQDSVDKIVQGIELVGKQSYEILAKIGVEEIPVERGTKFDPNLHEAVMHIEDEELGENEVAQVFQKGYQYKDRVIRHAVVQVAN